MQQKDLGSVEVQDAELKGLADLNASLGESESRGKQVALGVDFDGVERLARRKVQIELPKAGAKTDEKAVEGFDAGLVTVQGASERFPALQVAGRTESRKSAATDAASKRVAEVANEISPGIPMVETKPAAEDSVVKRPAEAPVPQPETLAQENPFSTFSLNVSDVSFKLAAASLEKGAMPEAPRCAARNSSTPSITAIPSRRRACRWRSPGTGAAILLPTTATCCASRSRPPPRAGRRASRSTSSCSSTTPAPWSGPTGCASSAQCLRVLLDTLQPQDMVSVVTFSRTARLWVDGRPASQLSTLDEQVGGLTPEGGTNLEEAMNLAYATAARHYLASGVNRVVLLTDGAANLGNVEPDALKQKVEAQRKQGIALDCFGIGWEGYNDDLLEVLSRNGDGRYGFVNSPEEAAGGVCRATGRRAAGGRVRRQGAGRVQSAAA